MKFFLRVIFNILIVLIIFSAHFIWRNLFPFPLDHIHIALMIIILWLILDDRYQILVIAFLSGLFLDFISPAPFGLIIWSVSLSLFVLEWLLRNILTNHSLPTVFLSCLIGMSSYRLAFMTVFAAHQALKHQLYFVGWTEMIVSAAVEIVMTAAAAVFFYFFASLFIRRLNPKYLSGVSRGVRI